MRLECMGSRPRCHVMAMEHIELFPVRGGIDTLRNSAPGSVSNHWRSRHRRMSLPRLGSHRRPSGLRSNSMACM